MVSEVKIDSRISLAGELIQSVRSEIAMRIVGQTEFIDGLIMGIIAGGHVLVEGVPGLAKTLAVNTLSDVFDTDFKRIQFTPDLLPADLVGTMIFKQESGAFVPRKGPIFSNIVLADEINRAPAKVQAALLEAMAEKQVTIGGETYELPEPFFVLATQNPIEQEGTYQLPEAQLDRFMMKLLVTYPTPEDELKILKLMGTDSKIKVNKVLTPEKVQLLRDASEAVKMDEMIEKYIVSIVTASRVKDRKYPFVRLIEFGASPRATIYLYRCSKVRALFEGRDYVLPEDVKSVVYDVLRHRIVLSYEAEAEALTADDVIKEILASVPVP
ncbi:MAG: ATPase [Spirochaetaceae bacterium 4572_7]|nr:MAG: ATPase [Spirochaetaceae bacterium 4572_7]